MEFREKVTVQLFVSVKSYLSFHKQNTNSILWWRALRFFFFFFNQTIFYLEYRHVDVYNWEKLCIKKSGFVCSFCKLLKFMFHIGLWNFNADYLITFPLLTAIQILYLHVHFEWVDTLQWSNNYIFRNVILFSIKIVREMSDDSFDSSANIHAVNIESLYIDCYCLYLWIAHHLL